MVFKRISLNTLFFSGGFVTGN